MMQFREAYKLLIMITLSYILQSSLLSAPSQYSAPSYFGSYHIKCISPSTSNGLYQVAFGKTYVNITDVRIILSLFQSNAEFYLGFQVFVTQNNTSSAIVKIQVAHNSFFLMLGFNVIVFAGQFNQIITTTLFQMNVQNQLYVQNVSLSIYGFWWYTRIVSFIGITNSTSLNIDDISGFISISSLSILLYRLKVMNHIKLGIRQFKLGMSYYNESVHTYSVKYNAIPSSYHLSLSILLILMQNSDIPFFTYLQYQYIYINILENQPITLNHSIYGQNHYSQCIIGFEIIKGFNWKNAVLEYDLGINQVMNVRTNMLNNIVLSMHCLIDRICGADKPFRKQSDVTQCYNCSEGFITIQITRYTQQYSTRCLIYSQFLYHYPSESQLPISTCVPPCHSCRSPYILHLNLCQPISYFYSNCIAIKQLVCQQCQFNYLLNDGVCSLKKTQSNFVVWICLGLGIGLLGLVVVGVGCFYKFYLKKRIVRKQYKYDTTNDLIFD